MLSKAAALSCRASAGVCLSALRIASRNLRICPTKSDLLAGKSQRPFVRLYSFNVGEDRELSVSKSVEDALKAKDNIPDDYRIIYRAPLERYIKYTYLTTAAAITAVPVSIFGVFTSYGGTMTYPVEVAGIPLFDGPMDVYLLGLMLTMTVLNVAHTIAKYPFRIYKQPEEHKYIAVFQSLIPLLVKRKEFKAGEVRKSNGIIWKDSLYAMKNKNVILVIDHFISNYELERMMIEPPRNTAVENKKRRSRMV